MKHLLSVIRIVGLKSDFLFAYSFKEVHGSYTNIRSGTALHKIHFCNSIKYRQMKGNLIIK